MKKARLHLRLLDILIKRITEGTWTKWKTITHLAEITTSKSWLHLPLSSLRLIRHDTNKEYFAIKKNDKKHQRTWAEDAAKAATANNDLEEARHLHQMLHHEMEQERNLCLSRLKGSNKKTGVTKLVVEQPCLDAAGAPMINPDSKPVIVSKEVTEKKDLEKASMDK
eukprot:327351-Ditylum_brightwellii.AAC.1